ncbi:MAG TPA: hypothetical protein VK673_21790 [Chthoniobacterales bacterium]|nr:hypothetical protein [Chthoniobacterales bacterium]
MLPPLAYDWLKSSVTEHFFKHWPETFVLNEKETSREEMTDLWLRFMIAHDFAKIFISSVKGPVPSSVVHDLGQFFGSAVKDPNVTIGYLLARPVRMGWVFDTDIDYFKTLFSFDPAGEVVWIDSLWAKGLYQNVLAFLRSAQKPYVAWAHKNRLFFKVIRELRELVPARHEIEEGFVRNV